MKTNKKVFASSDYWTASAQYLDVTSTKVNQTNKLKACMLYFIIINVFTM